MKEKIINTWLDIAPEYMDFVLKYLRSPHNVFDKVAGTGKVSSDLTNLLLGGVAVAYIIVFIFGPPKLQLDQGMFAQFLRGQDIK